MNKETKIIEEFPILKRRINGKKLVYLDNGATTQRPKRVLNKMIDYYEKHNANINRGLHKLSEESTELYDKARKKVAKLINSKPEETIFTKGTTESINFVARTWAEENLKDGDEILITVMEHHANIIPWQELTKKKKLNLKYVGLDSDYRLNLEELNSKLNDKTRLVALTHISNVLGTVNPIKEIVKIVKEKTNALVLVDGAQAIAHIDVDVKDLDVDFYAFSGHKMYGPTGIGVLYINKKHFNNTQPYQFGGDMIKDVSKEESIYAESPQKYEAGTPNIAGAIGLGEAVDFLEEEKENIFLHELELIAYARKRLLEIKEITLIGNTDQKAVMSFDIKGVHPHDVADLLNDDGIAIRSGMHCAIPLLKELNYNSLNRISFGMYNTKEDIDLLVESIKKIISLFR